MRQRARPAIDERTMMNDWKIMHQATHRIHAGRRLWRPLRVYRSNLLKSKSLPLASFPSVALLVTRILMVWIMMMKSSKMS